VNLVDHLDQLWSGLLDFVNKLVSPDWGALVSLLPLFVLVGVIGPLVSLLALRWTWYFLIKPRTRRGMLESSSTTPRRLAGPPPGGAAAA
jgi:hypothetical protein